MGRKRKKKKKQPRKRKKKKKIKKKKNDDKKTQEKVAKVDRKCRHLKWMASYWFIDQKHYDAKLKYYQCIYSAQKETTRGLDAKESIDEIQADERKREKSYNEWVKTRLEKYIARLGKYVADVCAKGERKCLIKRKHAAEKLFQHAV